LRRAARPVRARNAINPSSRKGTIMAERDGGKTTGVSGLGDFLALGARALASGVVAALALGFAALLLAHNAQAAGTAPTHDDAGAPRLVYAVDPVVVAAASPSFHDTIVVSAPRGNPPWSAAPAPTGRLRPAGTGALWAKARASQADGTATLLSLLGVFALGVASVVAVIGQRAQGTRA
jgi:hypothetical protein